MHVIYKFYSISNIMLGINRFDLEIEKPRHVLSHEFTATV
jgi:hypothetical protein